MNFFSFYFLFFLKNDIVKGTKQDDLINKKGSGVFSVKKISYL